MYSDLNDFIADLDKRKLLSRVRESVSPDLEIAALTDREIEEGARPSRDMRAIHSRKSLRSSLSIGLWFVSAHDCSFAMSRA